VETIVIVLFTNDLPPLPDELLASMTSGSQLPMVVATVSTTEGVTGERGLAAYRKALVLTLTHWL
jgi:hypothetical protein